MILLFGGAMSIGFCLWQTHAAEWLVINCLALFKEASGMVFILGVAFFVLVMTNFIMNIAAIAISLPVALVIAPYLVVAGEVIFFASPATAGKPFFLSVGAASTAIAYGSKQSNAVEFFRHGIMASAVLMFAVLADGGGCSCNAFSLKFGNDSVVSFAIQNTANIVQNAFQQFVTS
jgi:solute carrier family 13 (sodium-dependent dicarboxylate transporter), member 2/3/5